MTEYRPASNTRRYVERQVKPYPCYSALWHGFYSWDFYRSMAKESPRRWWPYLLLIVAISYMPQGLYLSGEAAKRHVSDLSILGSEFNGWEAVATPPYPDVTAPSAVAPSVPQEDTSFGDQMLEMFVAVDGVIKNNMKDDGVFLLVTQGYVMITETNGERDHSSGKTLKLEQREALKRLRDDAVSVYPWQMLIMLIPSLICIAAMFAWKVIVVLFYALLGKGAARAIKSKLQSGAITSIAIVPVASLTLLNAVLLRLGLELPGGLIFIITLGYTVFGILVASGMRKATPEEAATLQEGLDKNGWD